MLEKNANFLHERNIRYTYIEIHTSLEYQSQIYLLKRNLLRANTVMQ